MNKAIQFFAAAVCSFVLFIACSTSGSAAQSGGLHRGAPDWVRDPYAKYDKQANVAVVGYAGSREMAEKSALGNLVAFFGQSIQVNERVAVSYQEAVKSGAAADWSESTTVDTAVATSAGLDSLVGAEIGDTWFDGVNVHYAVAVMNKLNAVRIYSNMVRSNQAMIDNLINIPAAQKNSLEGYTRYQFAATVADVNISYGNLLSVIGSPGIAQGLKKGDDYRLEAANIAREIPITITAANDRAGRIQGAFAKAFSGLGFRSGGNNPRYVLNIDIATGPVELPNSPYKWTRIEITANLTDTGTRTVLLPYNFNTRDGHTTQAEADNRAYLLAERKINEEYSDILSNYLSQLVPRR